MKAGDSRQAQLAAHTRVAVGAILLVSPFWFTFVFASHARSAIFNTPPPFWFGSAALSNLDAALRTQMRAELAQLHQRLQATIVYVTHDQVEAMALGSRIAIFNAGRIEQVGTPMDLYERPRNRVVAGFLGSLRMNFMPAGVARLLAPRLPAGTVLLGVRPEHLRWELQGSGSSQGPGYSGLPVVLTRTEHLGDVALLHCRAAGADEPLIVKTALAPRDLPQPGQALQLQADPDRVLCFDAQDRCLLP